MTTQTARGQHAVVFGGTGLVGKELVNALLEDKGFEKVTSVARKQLVLTHQKLKQIRIPDFSKLSDQGASLSADCYFCCIGTTIKTAGSKEAFTKVDLEIPKSIARLAESLSIPSMVIISSIGANAGSSNFYLRTKGEMEREVRDIYHGNLKFVRPSLLMGKRDEFRLGERISVVFMKIYGWLLSGSLRKYKGINACDVAGSMIRIADKKADKFIYESDELNELAKEYLQTKVE